MDLILIQENSDFAVRDVESDIFLSDHCFVTATLSTTRPILERKEIKVRHIKATDQTLFRSDVCRVLAAVEAQADLDDMVSSDKTSLRELLDQHAPEKVKKVTVRPMVPWFREQALQLKPAGRSERNWRRHQSAECLAEMRLQHKTYKDYLDASKKESINETIDDCGNDQKRLFNAVSNLIGNRKSNPLPESSSNTELANDFANFFYDKVDKIR